MDKQVNIPALLYLFKPLTHFSEGACYGYVRFYSGIVGIKSREVLGLIKFL